jgi:hypothetical protein
LAKDFASFFGSPVADDKEASMAFFFMAPPPVAAAPPMTPANLFPAELSQSQSLSQSQPLQPVEQLEADVDGEEDQQLQEQEEEGEEMELSTENSGALIFGTQKHSAGTEAVAQTPNATKETPPGKQSKETFQTSTNPKSNDSTTVLGASSMNIISTTPRTPTQRSTPHLRPQNETPQTSVVLCKAPQYTYTSTDHFQRLKVQKEPQGAWYSVDLTPHVLDHSGATESTTIAGLGIKEYCLSITQWKRLFVGLRLEADEKKQQQRRLEQLLPSSPASPRHTTTPNQNDPLSPGWETPWTNRAPVRTISIRIRPDVLCGAVMDAVTQTLVNCPHSSIIKRQGGHLQATVRGQVPVSHVAATPTTPPSSARHNNHVRSHSSTMAGRELTFFVDVQLCTHKSALCERVLLLRIFHGGKPEAIDRPQPRQQLLCHRRPNHPQRPRPIPTVLGTKTNLTIMTKLPFSPRTENHSIRNYRKIIKPIGICEKLAPSFKELNHPSWHEKFDHWCEKLLWLVMERQS